MRDFTLLIKPAGPDCNLACKYCFYTGKSCMFGEGKHRMSEEVLDRLIESYMRLRFAGSCFAWQGGEPTLMGLDFFRKVVELQQKYGQGGQMVTNSLQTNAVLLDDDWCKFLSEYKFLLGISLDGPKAYHDHYRLDHAGNGTFDKVMAAIDKCREHKAEFNILVLLNDKNVVAGDELFDFFTARKIKYLQFIPCVEVDPETGRPHDFSITAEQYGEFLCRIFDRWLEYGPGKLSIRILDSMTSFCLGMGHTECVFSPKCDDYIVIEHNGDAFSCDFFVEDAWRLGNILDEPIEKLAAGKTKRAFSRQKQSISDDCLVCRHLDICRGGCLKDRLSAAGTYEAASYLCAGYKRFFDHAMPKIRTLAAQLQQKNAGES